jgi:hypothetical protein
MPVEVVLILGVFLISNVFVVAKIECQKIQELTYIFMILELDEIGRIKKSSETVEVRNNKTSLFHKSRPD